MTYVSTFMRVLNVVSGWVVTPSFLIGLALVIANRTDLANVALKVAGVAALALIVTWMYEVWESTQ